MKIFNQNPYFSKSSPCVIQFSKSMFVQPGLELNNGNFIGAMKWNVFFGQVTIVINGFPSFEPSPLNVF